MINQKQDQIPVIVSPTDDACDVYLPDMRVTVHGDSYTDAMAQSSIVASAIYYYGLEHNVPVNFSTTKEMLDDMCSEQSFSTFLELV